MKCPCLGASIGLGSVARRAFRGVSSRFRGTLQATKISGNTTNRLNDYEQSGISERVTRAEGLCRSGTQLANRYDGTIEFRTRKKAYCRTVGITLQHEVSPEENILLYWRLYFSGTEIHAICGWRRW